MILQIVPFVVPVLLLSLLVVLWRMGRKKRLPKKREGQIP